MRSLVVDDDSQVRALYSKALQRLSVCDAVSSGEEACQSVRMALDAEKPYKLILLDIIMPGIDGLETLHKIREIEAEKGVQKEKRAKVIMVTGLPYRDCIASSFKEQCEGYLVKPFPIPRLFEVIKCLDIAGSSKRPPIPKNISGLRQLRYMK